MLVAVVSAVVAVRGVHQGWALFERTLETSGQLAIHMAVVAVFALATLAASLGLDLLLGGFVAGVIVRIALKGREVEVLESKLTAVGYGFFIPFFFVVSGVKFDLSALTDEPLRLLELPLFLACFLVVRGVPATPVPLRARFTGAPRTRLLLGHQLPLVVAITTIAVEQDHMRASGGLAGGGRDPLHHDLPAGGPSRSGAANSIHQRLHPRPDRPAPARCSWWCARWRREASRPFTIS